MKKTILYKYLPISRIKYLENELLRFTQPKGLNDPFECLTQRPLVKDVNDDVNQYFPKEILNQNLLDELFSSAQQMNNDKIGILSLSKRWNNALMWAHYAISHTGFCVGFNTENDYFEDYLSTDTEKSKTTKKVKYKKERVKIPLSGNEEPLGLQPFFTKSKDWKYEKEVRMIATLNIADAMSISNREVFLFKVPHKSIVEIIGGANIEKENEKIIKAFCVKNKIKFYKGEIADRTFDVQRA